MRLRLASISSLILLALVAQETPAAAQGGLFGWLNGQRDDRYPQQQQRPNSWFGRQERQETPPQASAYSDPYGAPAQSSAAPSSGSTGRSVAYCVRLCDGRYFPMHRQGNATSIQLCNAFCPTAKTQVFNGSAIDHAVSGNGARYSSLENAFVYRDKIVPSCTCNGKDSFGLSRIDVAADPTLKAGDVVATGDNVKAALLAMHAAKERATAREAATNERVTLRGSASRRAALGSPQPTEPVPSAVETDEKPED